jgi:ABC-type proline/glycine betaine transport system substrate-binding protein
MERIYSALEKYGIHITDYTGQKYIEGMNGIDIVSVEAQEGLEQVIGEIISPTVEINGEIAQRAKAIIKDLKTFEEEKIANTTEKKADQRKKKIHWKKLVGYTIVVTILL